MNSFASKGQKYVTTAALYEKLIPEIINEQAYYGSDDKLLDIDKFIAKTYVYEKQGDGVYGWTL